MMQKLGEIAAAALEKPAPVHEIFLLQLDRGELELFLAHISALYVAELSRQTTPTAVVLTSEGGTVALPDWIAQLGARKLAREATKYLDDRGYEGARATANKLTKILGRPEL